MSELNRIIQKSERAVRQINDLSKTKESESPDHQDEDILQIYYHRHLLRCAESTESVPLQKSWIGNILKKSGSVRWKKNNILGILIEEIKAQYIINGKQFYVDNTILPIPNIKHEPKNLPTKPLTRALGEKPKSYPLFLKIKKLLEKQLNIYHPTLTKIRYLKKHR